MTKFMETVRIPSRLELTPAIDLVAQIQSLDEAKIYVFDFTSLTWIEPFGLLFTSQAICDLQDKYPDSKFQVRIPNMNNACSYAAWMGFFQAARIDYGNNPGDAPGSPTYIPVTFESVSGDLIAGASNVGGRIEFIAQELATKLTREYRGNLYSTVAYSFREILRNVAEHSHADEFGYCAQYWPSKNLVEIAIIDTGIGLRQSLQDNPHLSIDTDREAILHALMPGISGKAYQGAEIDEDDEWANSGYGLYMNYRLCNEGGDFFICSGDLGLYRRKDEDNRYIDTNYRGTVLRLRLKMDEIPALYEAQERFRTEGQQAAQDFGKGAITTASKMSTMIRENFRRNDSSQD